MPQALVRLQRKGQMVIPRSLREAVGVSEGSLMKVAVKGRQLVVTPQANEHPAGKSVRKNRKEILRELAQTVAEIRQEAGEKGIDRMPMSEIRAAVTAMRRDLKKNGTKRSNA